MRQTNEWQKQSRQQRITERPYAGYSRVSTTAAVFGFFKFGLPTSTNLAIFWYFYWFTHCTLGHNIPRIMKRNVSGGNSSNYGNKKSREDDEYEPTFEEELGMMDNMQFEVIDDVDCSDAIENQESRWARPSVPAEVCESARSLSFHWLDIDSTTIAPLSVNPDGNSVIGSSEACVPVLRMYGVTSQGQSVLAWVHGFTPYFYCSLPGVAELSNADLGLLRVTLNQRVRRYLYFLVVLCSCFFRSERRPEAMKKNWLNLFWELRRPRKCKVCWAFMVKTRSNSFK